MIRKTTWIVLGLFILVLAGTLFWNWRQKNRASASGTPTPTESTVALFSYGSEAVAAFRLEDNQGGALEVWKDYSSNLWQIKVPAGGGTPDQAKIDTAVQSIVGMRSMVALNPVTDFNPFGLGAPRYTLTITNTSGESDVVFIGDLTPTGNGYYVRLDPNAPVVVSKYTIDSITKLLDTPPYEPTPTVLEPTGALSPTLGTDTPQP